MNIDLEDLYPKPSNEELNQLSQRIIASQNLKDKETENSKKAGNYLTYNIDWNTIWPFNLDVLYEDVSKNPYYPNVYIHQTPLFDWNYQELEKRISYLFAPETKISVNLFPDYWVGLKRFKRTCPVCINLNNDDFMSKYQFNEITKILTEEFSGFGLTDKHIPIFSPECSFYLDDGELVEYKPYGKISIEPSIGTTKNHFENYDSNGYYTENLDADYYDQNGNYQDGDDEGDKK